MSEQAEHVETEEPEVVIESALPFGLPDFEGLKPVGVVTKVNGTGQRIGRAMHLEERGVVVVEYEVSNVGHSATDDGIKRVHTLKVRDLYELEGKAGKKLLRGLRAAYRLADDARHGRRRLGLVGDDPAVAGVEVTTDGSGVLVTPGERGDLAGLGIPDVETFVIVLEGGRRLLWPDEFEDGSEAFGDRPVAGDHVKGEIVREVLDGDTGEPLEKWTDEDEDARLAELERAAAEAEAAGDREALAELERARGRCGTIFDGGKICARELDHPGEHVAAVGGPGDQADEDELEAPWEGYDEATVADVEAWLAEDAETTEAVFAVAAYEERHGARKGVLAACGRRAAELEREKNGS